MPGTEYPFSADDSERHRLLADVLARLGEPFGGPWGDNWKMMLAAVANATGRSDLTDCPRVGGQSDAASGAAAQATLVQWGFRRIRPERARPGDVLMFNMGAGVQIAVLTTLGEGRPERTRILHKHDCGACTECYYAAYWQDRVSSAWTLDRPDTPPSTRVHPEIMGVLSGFTPLAKVAA